MAYTAGKGWERASPLGHVPTIQHPLVQDRLRSYRRPDPGFDKTDLAHLLVDPQALDQPSPSTEWVMAVDGSPLEEEIDARFPSTRTVFLQVAGVLVDLAKLRTRRGSFADPSAIADAQESAVFAGFLPSSNLAHDSGVTPLEAFRAELQHLFMTTEINGRSLLETLITVEAHRSYASNDSPPPPGTVRVSKCPDTTCEVDTTHLAIPADGLCCDRCRTRIYPTDLLRIHRLFRPYQSNLEAAGRILSVAEQLTLLSFLLHVADRQATSLKHVAFIVDGPLALFGEVAPIKSPLLRLLQAQAQQLSDEGNGQPIIVGIEKGGEFVEHALAVRDHIPPGHLMRLSADYVAEHIRFRDTNFGRESYYGRKWFYRTKDERMLVITVPPVGRQDVVPYGRRQLERATDEQEADVINDYPTLRATCHLLDRIGTRLFDNAIIPVALAHHWAAYPLRTAGKVLKLHAEKHLGRPAPTSGQDYESIMTTVGASGQAEQRSIDATPSAPPDAQQ